MALLQAGGHVYLADSFAVWRVRSRLLFCLFKVLITFSEDDIALSTTLYGYVLFSRGLGNVLSTPIASALLSSASISSYGDELAQTGFDVGGGRFKKMIIYVGSCFAGAAMIASLEWGRETMKCR